MVDLTRMIQGGMDLAGAFGGGAGNSGAYRTAMGDVARMEALVADAASKRNTLQAQMGLGAALEGLGAPAELAKVFAAGHDPTKLSRYMGDMQEQGFRGNAVERALAGDWDGGNANLMGVANGPQALAAVQGQNLLGNVFLQGGGGISTTEQGRASMAADAARARASDASAASSYASAARTRQAAGIDAAQFGLQRSGQWNPGGKPAGGAGGAATLPVGALKELLGIEDAISGTETLGGIISKHQERLANGQLQVGPLRSMIGSLRTGIGSATQADVALNEWNSDLTKIVNESLRLNKGVQTEGDAQRAADELMNARDARTIRAALSRLEGFNQQARQLQQRKMELINSNYGRPTPPMPGAGNVFSGAAPAPGGAVQRATNPATGQIVELRNGQWVPAQ